MNIMRKWLSNGVGLKGGLISIFVIFIFMGCARAPKFDPLIKGPQMVVQPEKITLGVATLAKKTEIVFHGKGFEPGDSVFVKLLGVKKGDKIVDIPAADGEVDENGYFHAKVHKLVKINEMLRAEIGRDKDMGIILVIKEPPMPPGIYTARAISMESDKRAECKLVVKPPSLGDKIKDWIGRVILKKIVVKK